LWPLPLPPLQDKPLGEGEHVVRLVEAREIVQKYGWNTTCSQILNPGIELWYAKGGDAVVGYVRRARVRVVVGAPVCSEERLDEVLDEWHADCDRARDGVCYFGAEARLRSRLGTCPGFSNVVLGAQPVWSTSSFVKAFEQSRSLRYQLSRARNKGVTVEEWPSERGDDPRLWRILDEWLATRGLPAMRFMVEPNTLAQLGDRRLFVGMRAGVPVGFVVLSPVPARDGWLTEQFPRGRGAPNGTIDLILYEAVRAVREDTFVTMGIVPLSKRAGTEEGNPSWLNGVLGWARAHGRRFYDFEGLDLFKAKFGPDHWEPIYAISREPQFSPHTLWAIGGAFSAGSPLMALAGGLGRALRQEMHWAVRRPGTGDKA